MQALSGETYNFSAQPKVVQPRKKYREVQEEEDDGASSFNNLMYDKRVVRGNTYAAIVTSKNTDTLKDTTKLTRPKKLQQPQQQVEIQNNFEPGTPEPIQGRRHIELQTDEFVEQLTDKPPLYEKDTQTDFYIEKPVQRLFMPKKEGTDTETQIWDGELFDFDYEVEPLLQAVIGRTLEQSRMEVLEEEEIKIMKEQQKKFEKYKSAEQTEIQKLEQKEKRLLEESEKRKQNFKKKLDQNISAHQRMISRVIAKKFLFNLKPTVYQVLGEHGVFRNPLEQGLYTQYLPYLFDQVQAELLHQEEVQSQTIQLLSNIEKSNVTVHSKNYKNEMAARDKIREQRHLDQLAKEERRRKREEERRRKLEQERRQRLKDQASEQLVSKGEVKQNVLSQLFSDIESVAESSGIGLFGNIFGEVMLYFVALERLGNQLESFAYLKDFCSNTDNVVKVFKEIIIVVLSEGRIEIGINESCEALITEIDESSKIDNWHIANYEKIPELQQIIKDNISSLILRTIRDNAEKLGTKKEIYDQLITAFLKFFIDSDEIQQKIKFVKTQPRTQFEQAGICYMKPDLSQLPLNSKSDRQGQMEEPQNEEDEPKPVQPKNLAEADYANQGTVFNPVGEEIKVLVQHPVAELLLREEILKQISSQVKQLEGQEFNCLVESYERARDVQKEVLNLISDDYPIFDMGRY